MKKVRYFAIVISILLAVAGIGAGKEGTGGDDKVRMQVQGGHSADVTALSWSPDGKVLASGSSDKTVRLWRSDGNLIKELTGHIRAVFALSWSPDGKVLASGSWDNTVRL